VNYQDLVRQIGNHCRPEAVRERMMTAWAIRSLPPKAPAFKAGKALKDRVK